MSRTDMSMSEQESQENNPETLFQPEPETPETQGAEGAAEVGLKPALKGHQEHFQKFLTGLEQLPDTEAKLQYSIDFMESSIAQTGVPHFKSFWDARTICLNLFKENIPPALRSILWAKYNELSKEARRLKDILDEQSAFAVEQIEIAVKALEDDIVAYSEQIEKLHGQDYPFESQALANRLPFYKSLQHKLNLMNTFASRVNSLRKELIRTEMRVRQKNKFFQRLSAAGDKVFPVRKEMIKEVSDAFIADVDAFIAKHMDTDNVRTSLFSLREEIKALQNMAKILTLNTHSFTHTRMRLSECWDKIKGEEKERKKERAQQKVSYKQLMDESLEKLKAFNEALAAGSISTAEATKQIDELGAHFRSIDIGRDERQTLRQAWNEARKPLLDKAQQEELARQQIEQERDQARRQKILDIKQEAATLLSSAAGLDADTLTAQRDALTDKISASQMSKVEKIELERQLKPLRDLISEKKESSLLQLSEGDRESLQQLKEILKQRKERRQEIKDQIDALRKAGGSSGLDFEQAMNQTAQLNAEKERLDKINLGIKEVEEKISDLIDN